VSKQYRPWSPEQTFLLPPSPADWLPEGHLAYFVLEVVSELELGEIEAAIQWKDPRGERPYSPRMMTSLLLYGYCTGTYSSRKLERATYEDVACRVIAAGSHPHWTTINGFRLDHREALSKLFVQVLRLCARAGLKTLGHIALDGSKVQANASKHKAMSYGRMKEEEARLSTEIEALLRRAEEADGHENERFGANMRGDELPEELRRRQSRLERIREAKVALEKEAAEGRAADLRDNAAALREKGKSRMASDREKKLAETMAAKAEVAAEKIAPRLDDDDDDDPTALGTHRPAATPAGTPKPGAQRNFTDADSRIMPRNGGFLQAFNAQAAVTLDQVIVAHALTNDSSDAPHLEPMLERVVAHTGEAPAILTADTGYLSESNITTCARMGVDAYIPARKGDAAKLVAVPDTLKLMAHWAMQSKVASSRGKKIYALRKIIVEPVFGQIKVAMGFRRFSLRGLGKAAAEWGIVCTCHNLLKAFRARQRQVATA
jgi:transposase